MEETKVSLSNLALKHLVEELQILENGFINKSQTLENGWLKLKVHTKQGDKNLVITPTALFLSEKSLQAKQSPGGFSALLKKYLFNQRIISLKQHSVDRVVVFKFPEHFLVVELFAKGNLVLCNKEMNIIRAMRKEEWKDRKLEAGEEYKFPSSRGANPLEENEKDFYKKLKENKKTFFGASVDLLNASPQVLEFVFETEEIDKKKNSDEATEKESQIVLNKVKKIYSGKEEKPFLNKKILYSVELGLEKEKEFENITSALNELLLFEGEEEGSKRIANTQAKIVEAKKNGIELKLKEIEELKVKEIELKQKGEWIYQNFELVEELIKQAKKNSQAPNYSEKNKAQENNIIKELNSMILTELGIEIVGLSKNKLLLKAK